MRIARPRQSLRLFVMVGDILAETAKHPTEVVARDGRECVVNKAHPTEAELRSLGQKLTRYTKNEGNAYIFVYDDERAARSRLAAFREELTEAETRYHDRHAVAVYARNAETGFHQFKLHPEGLNGPAVIVRY